MIDPPVAHLSPCASPLAQGMQTLSNELQYRIFIGFVGDDVLSRHYCREPTWQKFTILKTTPPCVPFRGIRADWLQAERAFEQGCWRGQDDEDAPVTCEACGITYRDRMLEWMFPLGRRIANLYFVDAFLYKRHPSLPDTRDHRKWLLDDMYSEPRVLCRDCQQIYFNDYGCMARGMDDYIANWKAEFL